MGSKRIRICRDTALGRKGFVRRSPFLAVAPHLRGVADSDELVDDLRDEAAVVLDQLLGEGIVEIKLLQEHLHDDIGRVIYERTRRRPLILPVVVEV